MGIEQGAFVEVRGRPSLVEALLVVVVSRALKRRTMGAQIEVIWDAEIATS
jgi:hypothetical protein